MHLCLDIGNVLCNVDFTKLLAKLKDNHGVEADDAWLFLNRIQPFQDLGHTTMRNELHYHFGIKPEDSTEVLQAWFDAITPHQISLGYLKKFLDSGVRIAILSNIGHEHYSNIPNVLGPDINRCLHHMSCDVGQRKPSMLYYQSFLSMNKAFHGAIYVDDRPENLRAGVRAGFDARCLDTALMTEKQVIGVWDKIWDDLNKDVLPGY
jgi:FMN phosphatase YigB (HAD superfamily)